MLADFFAILMLIGMVWAVLKLTNRKPKPGDPGQARSASSGFERSHLAQTAAFDAETRADNGSSAGGGGAD
ncbi:hypothetical protein [Pseudophaeobacter sp.]|uniref:hypothetical protein n=1 Tax=Pseudophaeobacter sp. TaxID=1971739 RepID=UPI003296A685